MSDKQKNILDQQSAIFQTNSIDFDLKMVRGFALSYFIYGLIYWIQIQEFLVPLPMVYFFVPMAGLAMFVRSVKWFGSLVFLLIPFIVVKDFTLYSYPNISGILLILTFLVWSGWSWVVFSNEKEVGNKKWILPVSQSLIWLVWLVPFSAVQLIVIVLMLVGITIYVRWKINDSKEVYNLRVGLLIQLVVVLFLMQQVSVLWVSLS